MVNIKTNIIIAKYVNIISTDNLSLKNTQYTFLIVLYSSHNLTNSLYSSLAILLSFIDLLYSLLNLTVYLKYSFLNTL